MEFKLWTDTSKFIKKEATFLIALHLAETVSTLSDQDAKVDKVTDAPRTTKTAR